MCEGRRNPSIKGGMVIIQGYYTLVGYFLQDGVILVMSSYKDHKISIRFPLAKTNDIGPGAQLSNLTIIYKVSFVNRKILVFKFFKHQTF